MQLNCQNYEKHMFSLPPIVANEKLYPPPALKDQMDHAQHFRSKVSRGFML